MSISYHDQIVILKLEGRLVGAWVDELKSVVLQTEMPQLQMVLDIGDLTFADEDGERLLLWLQLIGVSFYGNGSFSTYLCKRLAIPLSA